MTTWITPDGITSVTPLAGAEATKINLLLGNIGGCIGETSALALIIGGILLISLKIIDWKIPVLYIGTGGDVKVDTVSGDAVTFKNLADGSVLAVQVKKVYNTGTDATDIIALY